MRHLDWGGWWCHGLSVLGVLGPWAIEVRQFQNMLNMPLLQKVGAGRNAALGMVNFKAMAGLSSLGVLRTWACGCCRS